MNLSDNCGRMYERVCSMKLTTLVWNIYSILILVLLLTYPNTAHETSWKRPGCHRVGHTQLVQIPNCIVFNVTLNACRGYCESYAIPSSSRTLQSNSNHLITSRAECCSIKETSDFKVLVECIDGRREVVFKSAKSCACTICTK